MIQKNFSVSQAELAKRGKLLSKKSKLERFVDLNTDLGQSRDMQFWESELSETLLSSVSSVNVPCFVHDGLPDKILELALKAKAYGCAVGAHIAYPDPANMGYEMLPLQSEQLEQWILVQLGALHAILKPESLMIEHIRPHGALYVAMATHPEVAETVARAVKKFDVWMPLLAPACNSLKSLEENEGILVGGEVILGKRYLSNGLEAPNQHDEWLSPTATIEQAKLLMNENKMFAQNGESLNFEFKTLHLSPAMPQVIEVADAIIEELGQAIPLNVAGAGASGWLLDFDIRQDVAPMPVCMYEDY